jgi:protoheme IX farnesyltransferase
MNSRIPSLALPQSRPALLLRDYAELTKLNVTTLIVMTAWCGYFFGAHQAGLHWLGWRLLHAMLGVAAAASGTAALNEVIERDVDAQMRRTAQRPLPAGRMGVLHATVVGLLLTVGGSLYLVVFTNLLTGTLTLLTAVLYLAAYTPLKRLSSVCTTVGAVPGAMPGVVGWTAACGHWDWGAAVLFAILFCWQFPHFLSIAWLYREDYARGSIRMLPVVESDGRSTGLRILVYSLLLVPAAVLPSFLRMAGSAYLVAAVLLTVILFGFALRLASLRMPVTSAVSKLHARRLLQATVFYLPLLFAFMMCNSA